MIKNTLQLSFRRIVSDKVNSLLKLIGLTIGLSLAIVIMIFVVNEFQYDKFHESKNQIYRVINKSKSSGITWATTPFVLGETLKETFPEIEENVHLYSISELPVKKGTDYIVEHNIISTGASFFSVFSFDLLYGDLDKFSNTPNAVILSKKMALKYFGDYYPLGEVLTVNLKGTEHELLVCGIADNFPQNSSIKGDFITNIEFGFEHLSKNILSNAEVPLTKEELKTKWNNGIFFTNFIKVNNQTGISELQNKLSVLSFNEDNTSLDYNFELQALTDIYFNSKGYADNSYLETGNFELIIVLVVLGILILLVASINYVNLTVAQIHVKNHFIAIRKVCGALRKNLIAQITSDSIMFTLLTAPFAILLAIFLLPIVSNVLGKGYQLSIFEDTNTFVFIIGIIVAVGALSGYLIGLRTTAYNAIKTLKNQLAKPSNKFGLRKVLVIFQMVVSVCLITLVLFTYKQARYSINKDLGFDKKHLLIVDYNEPEQSPDYETFKESIKTNPNVKEVSGAMWLPPHNSKMSITLSKVDEPEKKVALNGLFTDFDFENTLGLELVKGEFANKEKGVSGVIVNESAAKELGLTEAIGERTGFGEVIAVVKDFHISSTHELIPPTIIVQNLGMVREMLVKTSGNDVLGTIDYLKSQWKELGGAGDCSITFFDDKVQELYKSDLRFAKLITGCAVIAIFIAALGLIGLALFMVKQKTKEVGIRKVNGAKVSEILALLNKDFVIWTLISFVVACPIIYMVVNKWLESFAYKTSISWWVFIAGGVITIIISMLTVSLQTFKAAKKNPVEALRYE